MPTIEFTTYDTETVKNFKPVLAKNYQPHWWKRAKVGMDIRNKKTTTIRACPAMDDWLKSGWYLVANRDLHVKFGRTPETNDDHSRSHVVDNGDYASPSHPSEQMTGAFQYLDTEGPIRDAFKMRNPWNVVTPPGYSCFYLDPFLFQNRYFATWQGIIDTDKFNKNMDNAQIIFFPKVNHSFTIKEGTPLCQVIPYKREEWNASYIQYDHKSFTENRSSITSHYRHEGDTGATMDEWTRKPGMTDSDRTASLTSGGYRKGEYWTPKGKFYKEESPPPECPFHVSENDDSGEHQLELDLDGS